MIRALPRLDLDLHAARPAARWAAPALLALALAFAGDLAVSYHGARNERASLEAQLARIERAGDAAGTARRRARAATPDEIRQGRETYLQLTTPWTDLFRTLESAAPENIVVLAIEPDPRAGTVTVSGTGRDYAGVLGYVGMLQQAKGLSRVHLVRHEMREDDPQRAVSFSVSAAWKEAQR